MSGMTQPPARSKSSAPPPPPPAAAAKPAANDDLETQLWVIGFVVLSGFTISVIFGTSGMSTTLVDAERLSTIGNTAVKLLSAAAMLHINMMQLAHALSPKPKVIKTGKMVEAFAYYVVDWSMTFAGFAGWVLLATIIGGENGLGKSIFLGFLIALAAGGALLTSWGTEKLARVWLDMYHALNKAVPDYKPARKGLYSAAGWLGLFVSWGASFFGVINISVKAGVDMQYMPSAFAVGTAAFLLPLMLSGVEYYLLKVKNRSKGQNLALRLCFLIDGGVIFGGLGGIDLTVEVALGAITGPDLAMIATAIISKAFSAYVGSVGGEKPHIDAQLIDEEDVPAPDSHTHAPGESTASSATPAAAQNAEPAAAAHKGEPSPKPSPKALPAVISPEDWKKLIASDQDIMPAWNAMISPAAYEIFLVENGKPTKSLGCVPAQAIPKDFHPSPPSEPTYHPVGMSATTTKKATPPPPPADQKGKYDA